MDSRYAVAMGAQVISIHIIVATLEEADITATGVMALGPIALPGIVEDPAILIVTAVFTASIEISLPIGGLI